MGFFSDGVAAEAGGAVGAEAGFSAAGAGPGSTVV